MTTPNKLLDLAREACDPPTWYRLAKELQATSAELATWRRRGGAYDDEAACEIARLLKMPLVQVIAIREAARTNNEAKRARWKERIRRVALMYASALLACLWSGEESSLISRAHASWSSTNATNDHVANVTNIQIMRQLRRFLEWCERFTRRGFALAPGL
jgi:hypothetical protein